MLIEFFKSYVRIIIIFIYTFKTVNIIKIYIYLYFVGSERIFASQIFNICDLLRFNAY